MAQDFRWFPPYGDYSNCNRSMNFPNGTTNFVGASTFMVGNEANASQSEENATPSSGSTAANQWHATGLPPSYRDSCQVRAQSMALAFANHKFTDCSMSWDPNVLPHQSVDSRYLSYPVGCNTSTSFSAPPRGPPNIMGHTLDCNSLSSSMKSRYMDPCNSSVPFSSVKPPSFTGSSTPMTLGRSEFLNHSVGCTNRMSHPSSNMRYSNVGCTNPCSGTTCSSNSGYLGSMSGCSGSLGMQQSGDSHSTERSTSHSSSHHSTKTPTSSSICINSDSIQQQSNSTDTTQNASSPSSPCTTPSSVPGHTSNNANSAGNNNASAQMTNHQPAVASCASVNPTVQTSPTFTSSAESRFKEKSTAPTSLGRAQVSATEMCSNAHNHPNLAGSELNIAGHVAESRRGDTSVSSTPSSLMSQAVKQELGFGVTIKQETREESSSESDEDTFQCGRCKSVYVNLNDFQEHKKTKCHKRKRLKQNDYHHHHHQSRMSQVMSSSHISPSLNNDCQATSSVTSRVDSKPDFHHHHHHHHHAWNSGSSKSSTGEQQQHSSSGEEMMKNVTCTSERHHQLVSNMSKQKDSIRGGGDQRRFCENVGNRSNIVVSSSSKANNSSTSKASSGSCKNLGCKNNVGANSKKNKSKGTVTVCSPVSSHEPTCPVLMKENTQIHSHSQVCAASNSPCIPVASPVPSQSANHPPGHTVSHPGHPQGHPISSPRPDLPGSSPSPAVQHNTGSLSTGSSNQQPTVPSSSMPNANCSTYTINQQPLNPFSSQGMGCNNNNNTSTTSYNHMTTSTSSLSNCDQLSSMHSPVTNSSYSINDNNSVAVTQSSGSSSSMAKHNVSPSKPSLVSSHTCSTMSTTMTSPSCVISGNHGCLQPATSVDGRRTTTPHQHTSSQCGGITTCSPDHHPSSQCGPPPVAKDGPCTQFQSHQQMTSQWSNSTTTHSGPMCNNRATLVANDRKSPSSAIVQNCGSGHPANVSHMTTLSSGHNMDSNSSQQLSGDGNLTTMCAHPNSQHVSQSGVVPLSPVSSMGPPSSYESPGDSGGVLSVQPLDLGSPNESVSNVDMGGSSMAVTTPQGQNSQDQETDSLMEFYLPIVEAFVGFDDGSGPTPNSSANIPPQSMPQNVPPVIPTSAPPGLPVPPSGAVFEQQNQPNSVSHLQARKHDHAAAMAAMKAAASSYGTSGGHTHSMPPQHVSHHPLPIPHQVMGMTSWPAGNTTNSSAKRKDSKQSGKAKRTRRSYKCGKCPPCLVQEDCGKCDYCLDRPKFGGRNTLRQRCRMRQCAVLGKAKYSGQSVIVDTSKEKQEAEERNQRQQLQQQQLHQQQQQQQHMQQMQLHQQQLQQQLQQQPLPPQPPVPQQQQQPQPPPPPPPVASTGAMQQQQRPQRNQNPPTHSPQVEEDDDEDQEGDDDGEEDDEEEEDDEDENEEDERSSDRTTATPSSGGDGEGEFHVERIVAKRVRRGRVEYLLKWKGYPDSSVLSGPTSTSQKI